MIKIIEYLQEEMNKDKERSVRYFAFDELKDVANVLYKKNKPIDEMYKYLIQEIDKTKDNNSNRINQMRYLALKEIYHKCKVLEN